MDVINKVLFLTETPYNEYDHRRFGVETLERNNFIVEVWDLSPFILQGGYDQVAIPGAVDAPQCRMMRDAKEIDAAIRRLDNHSIVNCFIGFSRRSLPVYRSLSGKNLQYSVTKNNPIPIPRARTAGGRKSLLQQLSGVSVQRIIDQTVSRAVLRRFPTFGIRPATICLAGGERSLAVRNYPMDETTEILWLHAFDYDRYLDERECPVEIKGPYALFIDDYLPFHPDFIAQNVAAPCDPDVYYRQLRSLMAKIEKVFGVPVVIAAHPRSQHELLPDYFGGRQILRGKTPNLVKGAEFVITQASTSINFAILFRKPILFVTTDSIDRTWTGDYIHAMASEMQQVPLYMSTTDSDLDADAQLRIDPAVYDRYRNNYIKRDGTEDRPFWDIVATYLRTKE